MVGAFASIINGAGVGKVLELKPGAKLWKKFGIKKEFLENMGIFERAKILAKKMKFSEQSDLYLRISTLSYIFYT